MPKEQLHYDSQGVSLYYAKSEISVTDGSHIQRLIKGDLSNFQIDMAHPYTTDRNDVEYGLVDYIRTSFGERNVPTYLFDNHNHALFAWYEASAENKILKKGCTLIHIDEHSDFATPNDTRFNPQRLASVAAYAKRLEIFNFIIPAIEKGLLAKVIVVDPRVKGSSEIEYLDDEDEGKFSYTQIGMDHPFIQQVIDGNFSPREIIVDSDIDYFNRGIVSPVHIAQKRGYPPTFNVVRHDLQKTRGLMQASGVNTIATSPGFIDEQNAFSIVQQLLAA